MKRLDRVSQLAFSGLLMISLSIPEARGQIDTNAKIKSLFIYSFSKYVEWPADQANGDFIIGILGEFPTLYTELSLMAQSKTKGDQNIKVTNYTNVSEIGNCHILYVDAKSNSQLPDVISQTAGLNTLIVGDGSGLTGQGVSISFYEAQNKQKLEVSPNNAGKCNLKISNHLLTLSTVVD